MQGTPEKDREKQDRFFLSHLSHLVQVAIRQDAPKFTAFLDEREQRLASDFLRGQGVKTALFFGGIPDCERKMLGIFPEWMEPDPSVFPIVPLELRYSVQNTLSHRDVLGSIMALSVKRETLGDILVDAGKTVLFVTADIEGYLLSSLTRIGSANVEISPAGSLPERKQQEYELLEGTVPSLRLDCVVAFLLHKSRSEAVRLIGAGLVRVNGLETENTAKRLNGADVLSIRGSGKFVLGDEWKATKKDRLWIKAYHLK